MTNDPILDVDLEPGDAVWIPREHPHLATTVTPKRISVSFSLAKENQITDREWIKV